MGFTRTLLFSKTTMASSTTIPIDKTIAKSVSVLIENHEAIRIQTAMRNKIARDTLKKTRTSKNTAAATIQKTFRGKIGRNKLINDYEDQITKVEKNISDLRLNLNEQRPKGLRQGLKKLQDRKSEINTRGITEFNREQKKAENRILNSQIEHYENVIIKRKTKEPALLHLSLCLPGRRNHEFQVKPLNFFLPLPP